jgi:hypothetical protein
MHPCDVINNVCFGFRTKNHLKAMVFNVVSMQKTILYKLLSLEKLAYVTESERKYSSCH